MMKHIKLLVLVFFLFLTSAAYAKPSISMAVKLNGSSLTIADVVNVSKNNYKVEIDKRALETVENSHKLLLIAAKKDVPVYGLNRGVGLNKDKEIFQGDVLTDSARKTSHEFNMNDIYATSAAVGPIAKPEVVRAAMLIRLNTLLLGTGGVQPDVVKMFQAFLNNNITPIFPSGGSTGEGDITILAHIGYAMTGQGYVWHHGKKVKAIDAMKAANLKPLNIYGKDALGIFSSNAYTAGIVALAAFEVENLIAKYELLVALGLEGINGNIAPNLAAVHNIRSYNGQGIAANNILTNLKNSYLMEPS